MVAATSRPTGGEAAAAASAAPAIDLDRPWRLSPQVALRPESFGALAYHFGTRRLSFLKSPALLALVRSLADHDSAIVACRKAGIGEAELPAYRRALATLAETGMICPREAT